MRIIETAAAPNPRRVRVFLSEKGISVPYEQLDIMKLEHKDARFAALNPMQRVPILELDDGTIISETMAICRYFEAVQPEPALLGRAPVEIAVIEMWNRRMELNLFWSIAQCFRHLSPRMSDLEQPQVPEWGEANRSRAIEMLRLLDGELAERPFVAGDDYTVADITALVAIDFMKPARIEMPEDLTHLQSWHQRVSSRPSADA